MKNSICVFSASEDTDYRIKVVKNIDFYLEQETENSDFKSSFNLFSQELINESKWKNEIQTNINEAKCVIILLSKNVCKDVNKYIHTEIIYTLDMCDMAEEDIDVYPAFIDNLSETEIENIDSRLLEYDSLNTRSNTLELLRREKERDSGHSSEYGFPLSEVVDNKKAEVFFNLAAIICERMSTGELRDSSYCNANRNFKHLQNATVNVHEIKTNNFPSEIKLWFVLIHTEELFSIINKFIENKFYLALEKNELNILNFKDESNLISCIKYELLGSCELLLMFHASSAFVYNDFVKGLYNHMKNIINDTGNPMEVAANSDPNFVRIYAVDEEFTECNKTGDKNEGLSEYNNECKLMFKDKNKMCKLREDGRASKAFILLEARRSVDKSLSSKTSELRKNAGRFPILVERFATLNADEELSKLIDNDEELKISEYFTFECRELPAAYYELRIPCGYFDKLTQLSKSLTSSSTLSHLKKSTFIAYEEEYKELDYNA